MHIRKRHVVLNQIDQIGIVLFFSILGLASISGIWSIYLESILKNPSQVGFLITFFTVVGLLSYIFLIPFVEKNSKTKLYIGALALTSISYLLFYFLSTLIAIVILGTITSFLASLRTYTVGIVIGDKSKNKELSKNEGLIYTFLNISWLIGPLIGGFIAAKFGFRFVFVIGAGLMALSFLFMKINKIKDDRTEKKPDKNIFKIFIEFFKDKDRILTYVLSGGINFWWVLVYVYMPILIIKSGLTATYVGYFLFAIVIPLILLDYKFGKLAGKIGFRKIFFIGYFILFLMTLLAFFTANIYLITLFLIVAAIGAAMVEPTTEAYFFDIVPRKQRDKFYGPYNTTINVSHGIATFLSAIILLMLPFKFIFLIFSTAMLIMAIVSLKIKNIIEAKSKK